MIPGIHFDWLITPATIGIYSLIAGIIIWWIRGMPDRTLAKANARKTNTESHELDWGRFQKEIGRLEERIARLERDNEELRDDALKSRQRESNLEQKVRSQKAHIERLERRLAGMEAIFKLHGVTPEMQAEIDKLEEVSTLSDDDDLHKSASLNTAEGAVRDAKRTLSSTQDTCKEVKRSEDGDE